MLKGRLSIKGYFTCLDKMQLAHDIMSVCNDLGKNVLQRSNESRAIISLVSHSNTINVHSSIKACRHMYIQLFSKHHEENMSFPLAELFSFIYVFIFLQLQQHCAPSVCLSHYHF